MFYHWTEAVDITVDAEKAADTELNTNITIVFVLYVMSVH